MVFYRKYRPQTIDDLDNTLVRQTLSSVLKQSVTHAFLFTGPKGLGKTSTARIIAKIVNCTTSKEKRENNIEPCNRCDQCISITNGTNMDVLEIDAASNRGIDEIRELKEKIRLAPVGAKQKVYIIDEVHMLTTEAFNALLKTLEEPPAHAMFILCTTEPHKVPATIISRCFHLSFKPATDEELVRAFTRITKAEKILIDSDVLFYIASLADHGFRDGVKILEEVTLLAEGKKITKAFIDEIYKTASIDNSVKALLKLLQEKKLKESLQVVQQVVEQGTDMKYFIQCLLEAIHEQLFIAIKITEKKSSVQLSLEEVKQLFVLLTKAANEIKFAILPQLPLELAIIEFVSQDLVKEKKEIKKEVEEGVTVGTLRKQIGAIKKNQALYGEPKEKKEQVTITTTSVELMDASPNGEVTTEWTSAFWKQIISEMKNHNHTIAGVLRGCVLKSFDKKLLIIQTNYKFHKERLDDAKTREALIKICKLLTGKEVEVKVELGS